jgi:hypothetical protein
MFWHLENACDAARRSIEFSRSAMTKQEQSAESDTDQSNATRLGRNNRSDNCSINNFHIIFNYVF